MLHACRMVAIAIPLCLVGVSLITQPSILGFRKSQQRNIWGIVFASGQVRILLPPLSFELSQEYCTHMVCPSHLWGGRLLEAAYCPPGRWASDGGWVEEW